MKPELKQQLEAHMNAKEQAYEEVKKQRKKALIPRERAGAPTYAENQAAIKEALAPVNHKKQALKLFDQVISANAESVFKKLLKKATDDDDKDQMAALKLIADRLAPMTSFAEGTAGGNGAGKVIINISGLTSNTHANIDDVSVQGRVIDAEDVE
jgi:hypothetical protein